jgi:hypothetical protein
MTDTHRPRAWVDRVRHASDARQARGRLAAVALIVGAMSCGTSPSPVTLAIHGPARLAPGQATQFTVTAVGPNGTLMDVTSRVSWQAVPASALAITSTGLVTGLTGGPVTLFAQYEQQFANEVLSILPSNVTYSVSGRVAESAGPAVSGATVLASVDGSTTAQTQSAADGTYTLTGLVGSVTLRASLTSVSSAPQTIFVDANATGVNFTFQLSSPDLTGTWTATLTAAPSCAASLPVDVQQRTYGVSIDQENQSDLSVGFTAPSGPPTAGWLGLFSGRLGGSALSIDMPDDTYFGQILGGILERLSPTRWLDISGTVTGPGTVPTLTAVFTGQFDYYETASGASVLTNAAPPVASCAGVGTAVFQRLSTTTAHKRLR